MQMIRGPVDRHEQLDTGAARSAMEVGEHRGGGSWWGGADDDGDAGHRPPAEGSGSRLHGLVGLAPDDGVDHEGLQPGIPRTARLGRLCVDLGGGERDLTAVPQDRLAGEVALPGGGEPGDLPLDHGDDRADEVEGLGERDGARQLSWGRAEDVGRDGRSLLVPAEPLEERGDPRLGDEAHPRPVLGRERSEPLVIGLHLLNRRRPEVPGRAGDPAAGGCRRAGAGGRHTRSVFVCRMCTSQAWPSPSGRSVGARLHGGAVERVLVAALARAGCR